MSHKGQSTVEYVLLLAVVLSLIVTVMQSDGFKKFIGKDSRIFTQFQYFYEYTYRHAQYTVDRNPADDFNSYSGNHESYTQLTGDDTRFFLVRSPYGAN